MAIWNTPPWDEKNLSNVDLNPRNSNPEEGRKIKPIPIRNE
jgi:hypothetical protein